jgi:hypothetical protein
MNQESLRQAIERLSIRDVRLDNATIRVDESFDPLFPDSDTLNIQFKSGFRESVTVTTHEKETEKEDRYLRAKYRCGFRVLLPPQEGANPPKGEDTEGWKQVVEVKADFIAYYVMKSDLDQAAIDEFSKHNVGYHVWPYWREYASSTAVRLRLPPVMPPLYVIPGDKV